jgi:hypothetical protein
MPKTKEYSKLPGKGRSAVITFETLWLGKDHVLAIYSKRFSEEYKRFYFKDIQAIITRKNRHGLFINIILGLISSFFSLFLLDGWSYFPGITAILFLLLLLINWLRGPTCNTYIQTAIQTEALHSLNRLKTAQKVMDRLKPLIEGAQGALRPEDITAETSTRKPAAPLRPRYQHGSALPATALKHESGTVHKLLYSVLLSDGVLTTIDLFNNHWIFSALGSLFTIGIAITVIMAVVRQNNTDLKKSIQNLTWISLIYFIIVFILSITISYILLFQNMLTNPEVAYDNLAIMRILSSMNPFEHVWLLVFFLIGIFGGLSLGFSGLMMLRKRPWGHEKSHDVKTALPGTSKALPSS